MRILGILFLLGAVAAPTKGAAETAAPSSASKAGPVRVHTSRDLAFGTVIPGVDQTVTPLDPNAGLYLLQATGNATLDVWFPSLPASIAGPGDTMPIRFEAQSAAVYFWRNGPVILNFDPAVGVTFTIGKSGNAWIYLGGVASPRGDQSPGAYSSPVSLSADYAPGPSL